MLYLRLFVTYRRYCGNHSKYLYHGAALLKYIDYLQFNYCCTLFVEDIETDIDVFSECLSYWQGDSARTKTSLKAIGDICHLHGKSHFLGVTGIIIATHYILFTLCHHFNCSCSVAQLLLEVC